MSRSRTILIYLGVLAVAAFAIGIWRIAQIPLQPVHHATARVAAIVPVESRFYADRDRIVVRAPHGTGTFEMNRSDIRCEVGDEVPVQQQGITLTRLPRTCR